MKCAVVWYKNRYFTLPHAFPNSIVSVSHTVSANQLQRAALWCLSLRSMSLMDKGMLADQLHLQRVLPPSILSPPQLNVFCSTLVFQGD